MSALLMLLAKLFAPALVAGAVEVGKKVYDGAPRWVKAAAPSAIGLGGALLYAGQTGDMSNATALATDLATGLAVGLAGNGVHSLFPSWPKFATPLR